MIIKFNKVYKGSILFLLNSIMLIIIGIIISKVGEQSSSGKYLTMIFFILIVLELFLCVLNIKIVNLMLRRNSVESDAFKKYKFFTIDLQYIQLVCGLILSGGLIMFRLFPGKYINIIIFYVFTIAVILYGIGELLYKTKHKVDNNKKE